MLLDELRGLHPYTTWTRTTPTHARTIGRAIGRTAALGVLRTYQTRHGAGPLAGEDDDLRAVDRNGTTPPGCTRGSGGSARSIRSRCGMRSRSRTVWTVSR